MDLQGILYDDSSVWIFILVTLVMGGAGGYQIGKAVARGWGAHWQLAASALALGVGVRFIHFALFESSFLTPRFYLIDTAFVFLAILIGFRLTRTRQMTARYRWLYERAGLFAWKPRASPPSQATSS